MGEFRTHIPRFPKSFELGKGSSEQLPVPWSAQGGTRAPDSILSPQIPSQPPTYMEKPPAAKSTDPEQALEEQEGQPMTVELEHYIITVGSHWLATQSPWPRIPTLTKGLSAPQASKTPVSGMQRRHPLGKAWGQVEREVQAQPRLRGAVSPGISFLTGQRRGVLLYILPHCHRLQISQGPRSAPCSFSATHSLIQMSSRQGRQPWGPGVLSGLLSFSSTAPGRMWTCITMSSVN